MADKNVLNVSLVWYPNFGQKNLDFEADYLTSENRVGKFDILPSHANFVSIIFNNIVFYKNGKTESYFFKSGLIHVSNNFVRLFLEGKID